MSYIQPNSRIEFYSDLNLSDDYTDSLYFESPALRDIYFTNLPTLAIADKCYYVRENRGFIRVELPIATLMHAQYMRFKNTSYENNWWYAFVKDVDYVNDNTTEVQFELDILMSWMGEFTLMECLVERQHSETDAIGDNLVDEDINTGEYVFNGNPQKTGHFDNWKYLVTIAPDGRIYPPSGTYLGLYNGLAYRLVNASDMNGTISDIMENGGLPWIQNEERIQNIQYIPSDFVPTNAQQQAPIEYSVSVNNTFDGVGGYGSAADIQAHPDHAIKNNKLYTFPYNVLCVYNSEGKENIYQYERFSPMVGVGDIVFKVAGSMGVKSEIICVPMNYKNVQGGGAFAPAYDEQMTIKQFPLCSWTTDTFKAFIAQHFSSIPNTLVKAGAATIAAAKLSASGASIAAQTAAQMPGASLATQNAVNEATVALNMGKAVGVGLGVVALQSAVELLKGGIAHEITPSQAHGESASDVMTLLRAKDFYFYRKSVNYETAQIIDNFFTMYGYADKTVHVPNMNARTRFTYVKTVGCKLHCPCPASDAAFIEKLFDRGIRFWKNHQQIGNYSQPNSPLV